MSDNQQNSELLQTVVRADEIVCGGCAESIKKALGAVSGVVNVDVDIAAKRITVDHKPEVSKATIVESLDRAGFTAV